MFDHICEVCFQSMFDHDEECWYGCKHYPALCCKGCACQSFEEAYHSEACAEEEA